MKTGVYKSYSTYLVSIFVFHSSFLGDPDHLTIHREIKTILEREGRLLIAKVFSFPSN